MRALVLLRGAMGAGKSTWIKDNGLEGYVLCPDTIRLMYSSPQIQPDSFNYTINQNNDTQVWALMFEILEERMKKGEFTIIDATHSRQSDFSRYNNLCETYRYRRYYIDFTDIPIEQCKLQNSKRQPTWKIVPESAIDKCYARFETQNPPNGWVKLDKDNIKDFLDSKPFDFNKYKKIHIFGDIHGCYEPLKEYMDTNTNWSYENGVVTLPEDEFFLFTGDYIDRGIQNKEVMELLCEMCTLPNTLFLTGNHEEWTRMFAFGDITSIRSKEFTNKTMYQLKDIPHEKLSNFVRKLGQMAYITYDNKRYFITHGGVPFMPDNLMLVSTHQLIHGVGKYTYDIDSIYYENAKAIAEATNDYDMPVIQIHGHRNTFGIEMNAYQPFSYNLESRVEFGGYLSVLTLEHDKKTLCHYIKNKVYNVIESEEILNIPIEDSANTIERLRSHAYIKETDLGNNISSFNFTRDAFYDKHWDNTTTTARGLFMNVETGEVVARAYNKFFNINEREETKMINIRSRMESNQQPAIAYKKYNGYLGILSYYNDELHFHSKSTDKSDFANWFKEIFFEQVKPAEIQKLKNYLEIHNVSLIFEVIDPINDPHIIKNDKREIILLDIVDNALEFQRADYNDLCLLARQLDLKHKEIVAEFKDFRSLMSFWLEHTDEHNMNDNDIEGVVIEIGNFMTKMKFTYYNFWKMCRSLVDKARYKRNIKLGSLYNDTANYFWAWLNKQEPETLEKDIITLRDMFMNSK